MKFLITSGGTKVPIDPVRDITNQSKGTFGSKLAVEALKGRNEVLYLAAEQCKSPFSFNCNSFNKFDSELEIEYKDYMNHRSFCYSNKDRYREVRYRNFDDYRDKLFECIETYKPDVIILTAAVSDYITVPTDKKIRSGSDLSIELIAAEKLISRVKAAAPDAVLVGFKLLVDVPKEELIEAAWQSILHNHCDLVVANDWMSLKAKQHDILIIDKYKNVTEYKENQAAEVIAAAVDAYMNKIADEENSYYDYFGPL